MTIRHLAALLALFAVASCARAGSPPAIRLALGDDLRTAQAQSTFALFHSRDYLLDLDLTGTDDPVFFTYTKSRCRLPEEAAHFVLVDFTAAHVTSVIVWPQRKQIPLLADAFVKAEEFGTTFERAGWRRTDHHSRAESERLFAADLSESYEVQRDTWACRGDTLDVRIRRVSGGYTVKLTFDNARIARQYDAENVRASSLHPLPVGMSRKLLIGGG